MMMISDFSCFFLSHPTPPQKRASSHLGVDADYLSALVAIVGKDVLVALDAVGVVIPVQEVEDGQVVG